MPVSPASSDSETAYTFAVSLTVYSFIKKKTAKGKVAVSKEEKSVKVKGYNFQLTTRTIWTFCKAFSSLDRHGQDQYMLSLKKQFSFKYIPPKMKTQRTSDAMDIDNETDYKEMAKKIWQSSPSSTKILIDMKDVKKLPALGGNAEDDDNETTDGNVDKLQAHYKNDHDAGYTYISPMGMIVLTLAMILDWCRALDEGLAM
ncbi:hypothetical protein OG21DRAFT_1532992 [Imleria badia]|nr:hypothetical protein OG21DRAFT_1532992 [Imleria badia]